MECRRSSKNQDPLNKCDVRQMPKDEIEEIKGLSDTISVRMKQFLAGIINECLELLGTPPCDYDVIVLGSLARNEMTPYSDFEWAILTNSEEEKCKVFFRNLTNLVHLQVGLVFVVEQFSVVLCFYHIKFLSNFFVCTVAKENLTSVQEILAWFWQTTVGLDVK